MKMGKEKDMKKYIKWGVIAVLFIVVYILLAMVINNSGKKSSDNYLLIGNRLIWNEIDGKFYQKTKVTDDILNNKFSLYNGNTKYEVGNLQYTDMQWYFFDKDYKEIPTDDFKFAYSGDLNVSPIDYTVENYDSADDYYIKEVAKPSNDAQFQAFRGSLTKVTDDFDKDNVEETIYFMTSSSLVVEDYEFKSYMFIVKNGVVTDKVISDEDPYNIESVLDIDNDGDIELVISYGIINNPTLNSCYQLYEIVNGKFNLLQNCLYD